MDDSQRLPLPSARAARRPRAIRPALAVWLAGLGLLVLAAATPIAARAQFLDATEVVQITTHLQVPSAPAGQLVRAAVVLDIDPDWHVNANQPFEEFLIPTEVGFAPDSPVSVGRITYPEPTARKLAISEEDMALYEGRVPIGIEFQLAPDLPVGELHLQGTVTYQACDDEKCLPPIDVSFELAIEVTAAERAVVEPPAASDFFPEIDWAAHAGGRRGGGGTTAPSGGGPLDPSRGLLVVFLFAFVSGLALNLTPCVYPMIPITISIFGSQGGGPRRAFVLALFYVLGMAITYSVLGTFAALSGSMLGSALQNPLVLLFIAAVMVALSLSMFGLYEITVPRALGRVAGETRQGVLGSVFMGLTVGFIAAPCIGPFVLALLTYVGSTRNPVLGFSVFFVLALGLGIPFLVLATVSGSVSSLPRSGGWMVWVRKVFGFILLGMAFYFLTRSQRLIPERFFLPGMALLALVAGVYLGWIERSTSLGGGFNRVKRVFGVLGVAGSIAILVLPRFLVPATGITWTPYDASHLAAAAAGGQPVIVDFSATWCIPCKELEHYTFATPPVVERAESFVTLKADLTDTGAPAVEELKSQYGVMGVPTVVFLHPDGTEMEDLRFTGVIKPAQFLERMEAALERAGGGAGV